MVNEEKASILYHNLFDYPLNFADLIKWKAGIRITSIKSNTSITSKRGFYFLEGREGLIYKRLLHKRISVKKMRIANKASRILSFIPSVRMIAVTGSLAMENSSEDSDIDLMIITKKGMLWTTRAFTYVLIYLLGIKRRKPLNINQRDALCLNMWLDESDLVWKKSDRNLYTAHELAQIVPLINKGKTYEKLLSNNKWILNFWPNSVRISEDQRVKTEKLFHFSLLAFTFSIVEKLAFKFQYLHMQNKISREVVTPTRALFHPNNWSDTILKQAFLLTANYLAIRIALNGIEC